jgi:hypothetical protein
MDFRETRKSAGGTPTLPGNIRNRHAWWNARSERVDVALFDGVELASG